MINDCVNSAYLNVPRPSGKRAYVKWSAEESQLLVNCAKQLAPNWKLISQMISDGKFTADQCRWKYVRCRKIVEGNSLGFWSKALNEKLQQAVQDYPGDWETIGSVLKISPARCRAHYAVLSGDFEPKQKKVRVTAKAVSDAASDSFSEPTSSPKPSLGCPNALPTLLKFQFPESTLATPPLAEFPLLPPPQLEEITRESLRYSFGQEIELPLSPLNRRMSDSWFRVLN